MVSIQKIQEGGAWYTSSDKGGAWSQLTSINTANLNQTISYPAISRLNDKIFVSGRGADLGVSYDQGRTWSAIKGVLPDAGYDGRRYAEGNGVIVSIGKKYPTAGGVISDIIISKDNGKTWISIKTIPSEFSSLVFNGTHFVIWFGNKLWRSLDGVNWDSSTMVKIDGVLAPDWWKIAASYSPTTGTYVAVIAAWDNEYAKQKAYRSTDGQNWVSLSSAKWPGRAYIGSIISAEIDAKGCP